jgi:hypothetical protein
MLQDLPALKDLLAATAVIVMLALTLVAGVFLEGWHARRMESLRKKR